MSEKLRKQICCLEDKILKIGDSLANREADHSSIATTTLSGNSNAIASILATTQTRADTNLIVGANSITNNIGGDYAVIDFNEYMDVPNSTAFQRIAPTLELLKNGLVVMTVNTSYQRHGNDHSQSSNGGTYTDFSPAVGDIWSLRTQRGSTQADVLPITQGHFDLRVVEKIQVLQGV